MQNKEATMWTWLGRMILMCIPIVNIVMIIVWYKKRDEDQNRNNWALANLVAGLIMCALSMILSSVLGIGTLNLLKSSSNDSSSNYSDYITDSDDDIYTYDADVYDKDDDTYDSSDTYGSYKTLEDVYDAGVLDDEIESLEAEGIDISFNGNEMICTYNIGLTDDEVAEYGETLSESLSESFDSLNLDSELKLVASQLSNTDGLKITFIFTTDSGNPIYQNTIEYNDIV